MPPIKLKISLSGLAARTQQQLPPLGHDDQQSGSRASTSQTTPGPADSVAMSRVTSEGSDGYSSSQSGPGPSTIRFTIGKTAPGTPSVASTMPPTPSYTPVSTPGGSEAPKKKRGRPPKARPSAIPPHLAGPPRSPAYVRSPPASATTPLSDTNVKLEHSENELDLIGMSTPGSPNGWGVYTPGGDGSATPGWRESSLDTPGSRGPVKWKRIKRPFKELADKVLMEMRRKDEYGFFLDPVQVDEYPGYLEIIGGEDRMMDLGTMQAKVTSGEYRTMEELETDFNMMIDNALKFNMPGTAAHQQANKIKAHGQKHIDRNRPLVLSPSPSPSQSHSALADSRRVTPSRGMRGKELKPNEYIPEQMLQFPPNSAQALAVGWNLTGGRRVRAKRFVRGRERFQGKWRDWAPDGSRDIAEMDDPQEIMEEMRQRTGEEWHNVVDWQRIHRDATAWFDWDGIGGPNGQAPLPGADKLKPPELKRRDLNPLDFGFFPEVDEELQVLRRGPIPAAAATSQPAQPTLREPTPAPGPQSLEDDAVDLEFLAQHLRPDPPRVPKLPNGWPAQTFQNVYDGRPAADYIQAMSLGSVTGEAYQASVNRFLQGAIASAGSSSKVGTTEPTALEEYATEHWHDGLLKTRTTRLVDVTVNSLSTAASAAQPIPSPAQTALLESARTAYSRIALRSLTAAINPLDLMPLLREPADFMHIGVGGKSGVKDALKWVGDEIIRLAEGGVRDNAQGKASATEPELKPDGGLKRSASADADDPEAKRVKLDDSVPTVNGAVKPEVAEGGLRQLRLELVALSKFYPLASLKKMPAADAARLLPQNVRSLMTRAP